MKNFIFGTFVFLTVWLVIAILPIAAVCFVIWEMPKFDLNTRGWIVISGVIALVKTIKHAPEHIK